MKNHIEEFVARLNYLYGDENHTFRVSYGRKYAKIINVRFKNSESVHCFVEIATGDIYKAATWKAPAKHVRGNILTENGGMEAVGPYGAAYLI